MNRYNIHGHLLEMGHDWEEAEAITSGLAEAERDAEIEREYAFREEAVYRCLVDPLRIPRADWR